MTKSIILSVLVASVLTFSACGKKDEAPNPIPTSIPTPTPTPTITSGVTVSTIALGSAIAADKKIAKVTESFGAKDTIYASVDTTGAGTATLKARWTYRKSGQESLVKEETQTIVPTGPASSEFHVSKPDGWPPGDYQVEIFVADKPAGNKPFTVK